MFSTASLALALALPCPSPALALTLRHGRTSPGTYIVRSVGGSVDKLVAQVAQGRVLEGIPELVEERVGQVHASLGRARKTGHQLPSICLACITSATLAAVRTDLDDMLHQHGFVVVRLSLHFALHELHQRGNILDPDRSQIPHEAGGLCMFEIGSIARLRGQWSV